MHGKPRNSGENSNGTVHPGGNFPEKSNIFRVITFPVFPKRPKLSVPLVWITSARVQVERKRKIYRYYVNGQLNPVPVFADKNKIPATFDGNFSPKCPYKW